MKLIVVLLLLAGFFPAGFSQALNLSAVKSNIAAEPYFGIGDIIYQARLHVSEPGGAVYDVKYRYIRLDDKSITLRYEYDSEFGLSDFDKKNSSEMIILTIDERDKAYLRIHELPRLSVEFKVVSTILVLSVYDRDRSLITVEVFDKEKDYSQPQW